MHENINNKTTKLCVLCGLLLIKICILNYLVVSVYWFADVFAQFEQSAYASAVSIPYEFCLLAPSNLHLDSKQLASEFLQDALSKSTR